LSEFVELYTHKLISYGKELIKPIKPEAKLPYVLASVTKL
jgi:hypothetical protein